MLQRKIPSTGEKLPVIGIGSWIQFDVGTSADERKPLEQVLLKMHEKGGRLIDSSPMYGKSEKVIGDITSELSVANDFFYATKVWTDGREEGIRQMQSSLQKMKRKTMDLIQIHNLQDWQTHEHTLNEWKSAGLVRYTGITHYRASAHDAIESIVKKKAFDFAQFNYSVTERNAERSLLQACRENGVAVIINEPFDKGKVFDLVKGRSLPAWAAEYNIHGWPQFFLAYIISDPAVTCVIPGTSSVQHVSDNMDAGSVTLPEQRDRHRWIDFINGK